MRILLWHGYLLGGTGSNVYTRMLAREWSNAGHDVTVLSQEPNPGQYDLGTADTVRPDVGGLLPVFVLDRYDGYDVRRVQDCSRAELEAWVEANASAVRAPAARRRRLHESRTPRRPCWGRERRAVRGQGARLRARVLDARECRAVGSGARRRWRRATATYVGSEHIRTVLDEVCGHTERVFEVPPGVDIDEWAPEARDVAAAALVDEARTRRAEPG